MADREPQFQGSIDAGSFMIFPPSFLPARDGRNQQCQMSPTAAEGCTDLLRRPLPKAFIPAGMPMRQCEMTRPIAIAETI